MIIMDKYTLSQHDSVQELARIQTSIGLNDTDFCRRVKFTKSSSSWGKIKAGTYAGSCMLALSAVQEALCDWIEGREQDTPKEVTVKDGIVLLDHIRDAADAVAAARVATDEHRLVLIVAPAGGGKTYTARYIAAQYGGQIIDATPSWAKSYMHTLAELARGLGIGGDWRSAGAAESAILQALSISPRLIIIDEANHFSRDSLNLLKTILNKTRCCIVLLTIPTHLARMAADCREEFPQLLRRSVAIIHIPAVGIDDLIPLQRGLYPDLTLDSPVQICNAANLGSAHRLDTARRVLDEMAAGKGTDAAIRSASNQTTAVLR